MNHVLIGDLSLQSGSATNKPGGAAQISSHNKATPYKLKLVDKHQLHELEFEKTVREKLDHIPVVFVEEDEAEESGDESEEEDFFNEQEIEGLIL